VKQDDVALEKRSDHLDAGVKKDADLVLEEIRNSILRNVSRILTHQPHVKKDWERNLQKLERAQYSSDLLLNATTSQVKLSPPGGDTLPWETTTNDTCEAFPWDKPVDDTLHVPNVSKDPQMDKVSVSNSAAFDATRHEAATSKKDSVEELSPPANTSVSTSFSNSESEPCKDESLMSTSQVRGVDVVRGDSIDKASGMSDDTLRTNKSSKMDSLMSTKETNPRREQPSLLELLRQPLEDKSPMLEKIVTTPEKVSHTTLPSQPSSLLDLLNDDSATKSGVDTQIVQNTFNVDVPSESSTSWATDSSLGNESIEIQLAVQPQSQKDLLRRPIDDEFPSIECENWQIASSAGTKPKMRVEGVTTSEMSACDFDKEPSDIIPALGSSDLITDDDEDDNKVAPDIWGDDPKENPKTVETPKVQVKESDTRATMPSFDFGNDLDDAMPTLGVGEETLHKASVNNRLAPENGNNVSGTGYSWQTYPSTTSLVGEDTEYQPRSSVLDQGLAILLAMKDRDWEQLEPVVELPEDKFSSEDEVIEIELESDSESEKSSDEDEDKRTSLDENEDDASLVNDIRDLLEWTSFGEILLSTADYNVVLLQLATSTLQTDEVIKMMVKTYRHMTEVGRSDTGCAPDAITYTILMVALDRRARAPSSAAEICRKMMSSNVKLRPEAVVQGIHAFQRRNNVIDAECLLNCALDSESHETTVPITAWLGLLQMYKHHDMQQEAVNLITRCIQVSYEFGAFNPPTSVSYLECAVLSQVNGAKDNRCVSRVITDVIYWPRKDFRGRRINPSQLLTNVLDLLESKSLSREGSASKDIRGVDANDESELFDSNWVVPTDDASVQSFQGREYDGKNPSYMPSYMAWRQLILSLSTAAEAEEGADWPIVHRAFTAMQSSLATFCPDALILKVGIRTAEMNRDADLATDLVIRAQDAEFEATHESHADSLWLESGQAIGDPECESVVHHPTESDLDSIFVVVKGSDDLSVSTNTSLNVSVDNADTFNSQEVQPLFNSDIIRPDSLTFSSCKPRHNSVRVTPQAFASAIRLCVATDNMTSAQKLLDCLRDPRNSFPSSVKSDLYTLAMKGYAKSGDSETALNLLKEMQKYGPKPT
jgi:pentatricopeptide repeat protein